MFLFIAEILINWLCDSVSPSRNGSWNILDNFRRKVRNPTKYYHLSVTVAIILERIVIELAIKVVDDPEPIGSKTLPNGSMFILGAILFEKAQDIAKATYYINRYICICGYISRYI